MEATADVDSSPLLDETQTQYAILIGMLENMLMDRSKFLQGLLFYELCDGFNCPYVEAGIAGEFFFIIRREVFQNPEENQEGNGGCVYMCSMVCVLRSIAVFESKKGILSTPITGKYLKSGIIE